jgi:hypothetical protein
VAVTFCWQVSLKHHAENLRRLEAWRAHALELEQEIAKAVIGPFFVSAICVARFK